MDRESLFLLTLQSAALFLIVWLAFRLMPSIPANTKAWVWRLTFLKPIAGLIPFAAVKLPVLQTSEAFISVGSPSSASVSPLSSPTISQVHGFDIDPLLVLWLVGSVSMLAYGFRGRLRVMKVVRVSEPIDDPATLNCLNELMNLAGRRTPIRLLQSRLIEAAMLVGGRKPAIVLPSSATEPSDIRLMLAHEVAHIARRDLAWFGLAWIAQSLFFFNPFVWLAARCSRLDHESATDRYASELAGVPIQTYAEMLLRATVVARTTLAPGALSMSESFRTIHRRLEAMKYFHSQPSLWRKTAICAVALVTAGLLPMYQVTAASTQNPQVSTASPSKKAQAPSTKPKAASTRKSTQKGKAKPSSSAPSATPSVSVPGGIPPRTNVSSQANPFAAPAPARTSNSSPFAARATSVPAAENAARATELPGLARSSNVPSPSVALPRGEATSSVPFAAPTSPTTDVAEAAASPVPTVKPADPSSNPFGANSNPNVTFKFSNYDIRKAIEALFQQFHKSYVIESGLKGEISASVEDIPFDEGLNAILKAVGGTYRIEGKIYTISLRK